MKHTLARCQSGARERTRRTTRTDLSLVTLEVLVFKLPRVADKVCTDTDIGIGIKGNGESGRSARLNLNRNRDDKGAPLLRSCTSTSSSLCEDGPGTSIWSALSSRKSERGQAGGGGDGEGWLVGFRNCGWWQGAHAGAFFDQELSSAQIRNVSKRWPRSRAPR